MTVEQATECLRLGVPVIDETGTRPRADTGRIVFIMNSRKAYVCWGSGDDSLMPLDDLAILPH